MGKRERAQQGEPSEAAAKRASHGGGENPTGKSQYRAGSIIKVKVKNFMTYAACEIKPAPKLNLVLGPNGTGKSSFVCAICVGLGGSTKLLGRADSVKEFIRRGQEEGSTEVTISDGAGGKHRVFRKIMSNNKSEWKIDGRSSNHNEVKKLVLKYNIQLDNLCSDKVVEFARLKPRELLTETEKALGDSHLHSLHEQLIEIRNSMKNNQSTLEAYNKELEKLRQSNGGIERDVERFQQREALKEQRDLYVMKRRWVEATEAKQELREKREARNAKEEELQALRLDLEKEQQPLRIAKEHLQNVLRDLKTAKGELVLCAQKQQKLQEDTEAVHDTEITVLKDEIASLESESQSLRQRVEHQRARVRQSEEALAALPPVQHNQRLDELVTQSREMDVRHRELLQELRDLESSLATPRNIESSLMDKIRQQDDLKRQKVSMLERAYKGITRMWEWVQANEAAFRGKVWGPVLSEVKVSNPKLATFLENQVSFRTWSCFVTEYPSDQKVLMEECKKQLGKHNIIVVNYNGNPQEPLTYPRGRAEEYQADGIECTLDAALTDTPPIITRVLNDDAQLSSAFVGSAELQKNYGPVLLRNKKIGNLYLPDTHIRVSTSRYNASARSTEVSGIRNGNLLAHSSKNSEREQLVKQLQQVQDQIRSMDEEYQMKAHEVEQVHQALQGVEEERNALQKERQHALTKRRQLQSTVTAQRKMLQSYENKPDPLAKRPALETKLTKACKKLGAFSDPLMDNYRNMSNALKKVAIAEMKNAEAEMIVKSIHRGTSEKQAQASVLEAAVAALQLETENAKERFEAAKREAKENNSVPEGEEGEELRQKLRALTGNLEELQQEIDSLTAQAEGIPCSNTQVMEEYKKRCAKIKTLQEKAAAERDLVENGTERIETIKGEWLPQLQDLVGKINDTFRVNFAEIGFAGEVELKEDDDFDKYEIQIKVKFRADEELQVLTASRQSGGERSVCTILYLIALQGVTECPFRVVDEINQGMDPNNERKVFKQLVESSCKPDTPQCFLLTPKLLPDLPFTQDVRVLNIFNGPWVGDVGRNFSANDLLPPP